MNLAEKVRQVHELKKDYKLALKNLGKPYGGFAMTYDDLEGNFNHTITRTENDEVYFLVFEDFYCNDYISHVDSFSCENKTFCDAQKLAHQHGFKTEIVALELETPWYILDRDDYLPHESAWWLKRRNIPPTIKALKITW